MSALEALLVYEEDGAAPGEVSGKPAHRYRSLIATSSSSPAFQIPIAT